MLTLEIAVSLFFVVLSVVCWGCYSTSQSSSQFFDNYHEITSTFMNVIDTLEVEISGGFFTLWSLDSNTVFLWDIAFADEKILQCMLSCVLNFGWGVQASSAAEQINQRHKQQININSLTIHQARWNHEKRLKMQHNTNVSSVSRPQRKRDAQRVLPNASAFGTFKRVGWPSCDGSYPIKGS